MFDLTIERRQPIVNQTAFIDMIGPRAQLYDDLVISDPMTASSQTKPQPKTDRGERTRQKILAAAGSEIGKRGFSVTSISDITAAAGVGQGTFYIYFQSKEDVLRELVLQMGRELRQHLSDATTGTKTRLDAEREGLLAFIEFVRANLSAFRQEANNVIAMVDRLRAIPDAHRAACARAYTLLRELTGSDWSPSATPDHLASIDPDTLTI